MRRIPQAIAALLLVSATKLLAAQMALSEPVDYQVVQRFSGAEGRLRIRGTCTEAGNPKFEARILAPGAPGIWRKLSVRMAHETFAASLKAPAGGWYRLEVRMEDRGMVIAECAVEHVGVGEVFVVAGQSNSANHGEEKQVTQTGRVAAWNGHGWQLAKDPQPGASGSGGSFMPPLGDAIVRRFDVPVGFVACGIGATSVREWLPKGATFPNPPTIESRVRKLPDGKWASNGEAFSNFVSRMKAFGQRGFRAVLWHQGESDANQKDPTRTLPGSLYREYLSQVIRESRREIGWKAPWFVALASYHVPGDEASPEIRAAQSWLWHDGLAWEGPDSDSLKGEFREQNGRGVHFSGKGLREHAAKWAAKVCPQIERELRKARPLRMKAHD
jgi:hypothetical protein